MAEQPMTPHRLERINRIAGLLKTVHKILARSALTLIVTGLISYTLMGFVFVTNSIRGFGQQSDAEWMVLCILTAILGVIVGALGYFVGLAAREWTFYAKRHTKGARIPLEPMDKEPGWNEAVLHWFHNGPELREPNDDYRAAFDERAQSRRLIKKGK